MPSSYTVKWRRKSLFNLPFGWNVIENVVGHEPEKTRHVTTLITTQNDEPPSSQKTITETTNYDRMVFYLKNGGVRTISHWKDCEILLGPDWVAFKTVKQ